MIKAIFITGVSGVGKSTVLKQLASKGYCVDDTYGHLKTISNQDGQDECVWDKRKNSHLLDNCDEKILFISGCVSNQGLFCNRFNEIIVFIAPEETILYVSTIVQISLW